MRALRGLAAAAALTTALTACSSDDQTEDADNGGTSSESNDELRPADDVASDAAEETLVEADAGEYVELTDDIRVTISDFAYESIENDGWFSVTTRVENAGTDEAMLPEYTIFCANSTEGGAYYATGTLDEDGLGFELPAESFREGTRHLIAPTDERSIGGDVTPCEAPAYVEITVTGYVPEDAKTARYAIPEDVLAQLG